MPFAEKNPRFRTKEEMAKDIYEVLQSTLSYEAKFNVLHAVTWQWSEYEGKYKGMTYWSKEAFESYIMNNGSCMGLRHEHIVPRQIVISELMKNQRTEQKIFQYLEQHLVGAIVTIAEMDVIDSDYQTSMPSEYTISTHSLYQDRWARYKKKGIPVLQVFWNDKKRGRDMTHSEILFE